MRSFETIRLKWRDREYSIEPDRIVRAIAVVEDVITLGELYRYQTRGAAPLGKLAMAYGGLLRYAGARVTDEEVYEGLFGEGEMQAKVLDAVQTLMVLMIPPTHLQAEDAKPGKDEAASGTTGSSPQPSASSSAADGAAPGTSGA